MKLKYISWLPALILMGVIFYFSSKTVDNSNDNSLTIANGILTAYESITNHPIQIELREDRLGIINHLIRKGAHFTEYALLAFAIAFHFSVWKKRRKLLWVGPIIISALYAASDEFHQTFVEGRGGQIKDVLLDTCGAITGTLLFCILLSLLLRKKNSI